MCYHKMHHFRFDDVKPRMMHLHGIIYRAFFCQGGSPNSSGILLEIQTLLVVSNVVVWMEFHFHFAHIKQEQQITNKAQ